MLEHNVEEVAKEINSFLKKLDTWATQLQSITVIIALTAVLASLAIGFFAGELDPIWIKIMALVAAFCTVSISALRLEKKARDLREGYRHLQYAVYKYKIGVFDISALVNAYFETEKIVGHIELDEEVISKLVDVKQNPKQGESQ
jgi:Na+/H+ antiporter NhaD/arsenite permease-like protein